MISGLPAAPCHTSFCSENPCGTPVCLCVSPTPCSFSCAGKALDASELEWSRYSDTLFEVFFAGGRLATAGNLADDGKRLSFYVSA